MESKEIKKKMKKGKKGALCARSPFLALLPLHPDLADRRAAATSPHLSYKYAVVLKSWSSRSCYNGMWVLFTWTHFVEYLAAAAVSERDSGRSFSNQISMNMHFKSRNSKISFKSFHVSKVRQGQIFLFYFFCECEITLELTWFHQLSSLFVICLCGNTETETAIPISFGRDEWASFVTSVSFFFLTSKKWTLIKGLSRNILKSMCWGFFLTKRQK